MSPKPLFPKTKRTQIDDINLEFYEAYEAEARNKKGDYPPKVKEFLEFCAYKNNAFISDLTRVDVDDYLYILQENNFRTGTINLRLSAIAHFRDFLVQNYQKIFNEKFLGKLPPRELNDDDAKLKSRVLRLKQLSLIRKYNNRKNKSIKDELIFELFFQLHIEKKDVPNLQHLNVVNPRIEELLKKTSISRLKTGTIDSYFARITNHLKDQKVYEEGERNINSYDLTSSNEAYYFTCPNCARKFENIAENWVLAKMESDENYRIVCAICKGE